MSTAPMNPKYPQAVWMERFVESVRQFDPDLELIVALELAEAEFPESGHLEPEEAAEAYANNPDRRRDRTEDGSSVDVQRSLDDV